MSGSDNEIGLEFKIMKVLVTGSNGFIGKAIVTKLLENDFQITTLDRVKANAEIDIVHKQNQIFADITKREDFENLSKLKEIDTVIHSAGLAHQFGKVSQEDFYKVNVLGTKNVTEWAVDRSIKHFILISSVSVYENSKDNLKDNFIIDEGFNCEPKSFYALSKFDAEKICKKICKKNKIKLTILRLATVVGEEDKGNFVRLIRSIDKRHFIWIGKGENQKSIIHKLDVARACQKILETGLKSDFEIYNISANPIKVKRIVKVISEVLDKKVLQLKVPVKHLKWFIKVLIKFIYIRKISRILETIDKWVAEDVYSSEKFNNDYDFEIKILPEEAIRREVVWYQKQK